MRGAWGMCGHCFPHIFNASCLLFSGISWANIRWIGNWWWENMGRKKRNWGSKMDWMDTEGKQEVGHVWESPLLLEDIWECFAQRGEATKDPCRYLFPPGGFDHQHGKRRCNGIPEITWRGEEICTVWVSSRGSGDAGREKMTWSSWDIWVRVFVQWMDRGQESLNHSTNNTSVPSFLGGICPMFFLACHGKTSKQRLRELQVLCQ